MLSGLYTLLYNVYELCQYILCKIYKYGIDIIMFVHIAQK